MPGYLYDPLSPLRLFALLFLFWLWPTVRNLFSNDETELSRSNQTASRSTGSG